MAEREDCAELLRILVQLLGRKIMQPEDLLRIVAAKGSRDKQLRAYNLCDGTRTQVQISAELGLDRGNFSRTVARWQAAGVLYGLGSGRDRRLLHVYPLPSSRRSNKTQHRESKGESNG